MSGEVVIPTVTLHLEAMRHAITRRLATEMLDASGEIDAAVKKAVADFDFGRAVRDAVEDTIHEALDAAAKSARHDAALLEAARTALFRALDPRPPAPPPPAPKPEPKPAPKVYAKKGTRGAYSHAARVRAFAAASKESGVTAVDVEAALGYRAVNALYQCIERGYLVTTGVRVPTGRAGGKGWGWQYRITPKGWALAERERKARERGTPRGITREESDERNATEGAAEMSRL